MRECRVMVHGNCAGILTELDNPKGYQFIYDENYLERKDSEPVCLAMPLSKEVYSSEHLFPYFSNLLAEGENRALQSSVLHLDYDDDFGFLLETATCDTVGAVTIERIDN